VPAGVRYKVTVSGIPETLQLKSVTSGNTDLMTSPLDLAATAAPTIIQIKFTAREQK
jgi:hypothetical protein